MDSSDSDEEISEESAGAHLFELLLDMKFRSKLSAKDACILAYWATMGGCKGIVKKLAKPPGDPSPGHYSSHLDRAAGLAKKDHRICHFDAPCFSRVEGGRFVRPLACLTPQEVLADEISTTDGFETLVSDYCETLPPIYRNHPVVQKAGGRMCIPLGLFIDGVEYGTRDSVDGVFWSTWRHNEDICS